jgi:hypothetical protein
VFILRIIQADVRALIEKCQKKKELGGLAKLAKTYYFLRASFNMRCVCSMRPGNGGEDAKLGTA